MIQLRTLGPLQLRDDHGRDVAGAAIRPKRLALLAYLAVARPHGFHRRDSLVALFWPELDQARARHSLSQGLHTIRRALGEGVVVTRGVEEVGVDRGRIWCDGPAFDDALERGALDEALELYRGDLLDGVFVADAPGFERWVEDERSRLRQAAARAARTLAEQSGREGRITLATRWAARAAELDPLDERALRRLMRARDRAGDRAGALLAYQDFARRLREELDVDPSPETRALLDEIRSREVAVATTTQEQAVLSRRQSFTPLSDQAASWPTVALPAAPTPVEQPIEPAAAPRDIGRRRAAVTAITILAVIVVAALVIVVVR